MHLSAITKTYALLACLSALVACIPPPPKATPKAGAQQSLISASPAQAASACAARASAPWKGGGETYIVEAFTDGPACDKAVAILVIRNSKSETMWVDTFQAHQNLALSDAKTAADMQRALSAWITDEDIDGKPLSQTTGDLPAWGATETQPVRGEFPFYTEEGVTREDYTKLRDQKLPMYCYVQGIESETCLALDNSAFEKIGAQSFPG